MGAGVDLACKISVILTYRVGGREGVIGELVVLRNGANEGCGRLPRGQLLAEEGVEYSTRGVKSLKLVLNIERRKDIVGIADGKVRRVGVIGSAVLRAIGCGDDLGIATDVVLCETVGVAIFQRVPTASS